MNYAPPNRHQCLTERIKIGQLAAIYFHFDIAADGTITRRAMSVPGKYMDKDIGLLLDAIAERINADALEQYAAADREAGK